MKYAIMLHVLAAIIWIGGMFFAYMVLRPVAARELEPPSRLALWAGVFSAFFPWVWVCILTLLGTGYWMIFNVFGGMSGAGLHVHIMQTLGILMMMLFGHLFFAPFRRLKEAVVTRQWETAAKQLGQIRMIVAINLGLGILVAVVASAGRYF